MKRIIFIVSLVLSSVVVFTSCEEDDLETLLGSGGETTDLSEDEIVQGLKAALTTGTDSSTSKLSLAGGYFNDALLKILLPNEIETAISSFKSKSLDFGLVTVTGENIYNGYTIAGVTLPNLKSKEDDLIKGLNQAAEMAAKTAGPVFKNAITGMSVSDGLSILKGADTSATSYLKTNTYTGLFNSYEPIVDSSLKVVKVGNKSVVELYEDYVTSYNSVMNTAIPGFGTIGNIANVNTIAASDLSEYGTEKALNGLFYKVSEEEKDIRKNPFAYVSDIIQKVFGSLLE